MNEVPESADGEVAGQRQTASWQSSQSRREPSAGLEDAIGGQRRRGVVGLEAGIHEKRVIGGHDPAGGAEQARARHGEHLSGRDGSVNALQKAWRHLADDLGSWRTQRLRGKHFAQMPRAAREIFGQPLPAPRRSEIARAARQPGN